MPDSLPVGVGGGGGEAAAGQGAAAAPSAIQRAETRRRRVLDIAIAGVRKLQARACKKKYV